MDIELAPELEGDGVRLRSFTDADAATRASLGRSREIVRGFGGALEQDEPPDVQTAEPGVAVPLEQIPQAP